MHGQKTIFLVLFALLMNLALAGATVAAERCVLAEMFLSSID